MAKAQTIINVGSDINARFEEAFTYHASNVTKSYGTAIYKTGHDNLYIAVTTPAKINKNNAHHVSIHFATTYENNPDDIWALADMLISARADELRAKVAFKGRTGVYVNKYLNEDVEAFVKHALTFA